MYKMFKILIIDKKMEAVTAFFFQKITKNAPSALLQLQKIDQNLYTKCIFCNKLTDIMLVMVYTDF